MNRVRAFGKAELQHHSRAIHKPKKGLDGSRSNLFQAFIEIMEAGAVSCCHCREKAEQTHHSKLFIHAVMTFTGGFSEDLCDKKEMPQSKMTVSLTDLLPARSS